MTIWEAVAAEENGGREMACAAVKNLPPVAKISDKPPLTALSLDLKGWAHILGLRMSRFRAIAVAVMALAVAALPVAGVGLSAAHAGCAKASEAPQAQHEMAGGHHAAMDHAGMDHAKVDQATTGQASGYDGMAPCGGHSTCGGKCLCLGLTAVLPTALGTQTVRLPLPATARVAVQLGGPAYVPPAPPPRV